MQLGTRTDNFTSTNLNFLEHYVRKIVPSKRYNKFIKCIGRFRKKKQNFLRMNFVNSIVGWRGQKSQKNEWYHLWTALLWKDWINNILIISDHRMKKDQLQMVLTNIGNLPENVFFKCWDIWRNSIRFWIGWQIGT